jgi:hypothetical protein
LTPGRNARGRIAVAGDLRLALRPGRWHLEGQPRVAGAVPIRLIADGPVGRLRQDRVAQRPDQPVLVGRSALADRPGGPPKLHAEAEGPPRMTTEIDIHETDVFATATRAEWLSAIGWMAAFFLIFWLLGALIAVPLFAVVYLLAVPRSSPILAGVYALASWAFVYGLFGRLLRLPLP